MVKAQRLVAQSILEYTPPPTKKTLATGNTPLLLSRLSTLPSLLVSWWGLGESIC